MLKGTQTVLFQWNSLSLGYSLISLQPGMMSNRVLKWWRHKNKISEIRGFVRILWKNNVQEAYLPKMNISGQIVSEMLAGYTQETPYKPF